MKLLIIEDNEADVLLATRALRSVSDDIQWEVVSSPEALADALHRGPWSAVISDDTVGGFSELEALRMVREHSPELPFIIFSETAGEARAVDAIRAGATDYVMKDRPADLAARLQRELRQVEQRRESHRLTTALQSVEQRYRNTFEKAPIGICHTDQNGRFIAVNARFCAMTGYSAEELTGRVAYDICHSEERELGFNLSEDVRAGRRNTATFDVRFLRPDATTVWGRVTLSAALDEHGVFDYMIGLVEDITRQRAGEAQLALQAQLLDSVEQAVIATDTQNRVTFWNRFAEQLYGVRAESVMGRPLEECGLTITGDEGADMTAQLRAPSSWSREVTMTKPTGRRFTAAAMHSPVIAPDGAMAGFVLVAHDITTRKSNERELQWRREQLADAQRIARLGSWEHDLATGRRVWSEELFHLLGLEPGPLPTLEVFFQMIHPDDRPRLERIYRDWTSSYQTVDCEFRVTNADGHVRHMHLRKRVERDASGIPVKAIGVVQDITEAKAVEDELRRSAVRQAVIANLGQLALGGASVSFLIAQIVASAELLDIECIEVVRSGTDTIERVASSGWEIAEPTRAAGDHEAEYVLRVRGRILIEDLSEESRFTPSPNLIANGIASGVLVTIDAGEAAPWGVIGAYSRTPNHFSVTDADFLRAAATVLGQAVERTRTEQELLRRATQQSAIAELGRLALTSLHDATFDRARELVMEGLGVEHAVFSETTPCGKYIQLRGRLPWSDVPQKIEASRDFHSGLTVLTGEPVIVEDYSSEQRFKSSEMFTRLGIASALMVPVRSAQISYGVLAAMSSTKRSFSEADVHFAQSLANVVAEAMERDRARAEVDASEARYRSVVEGASEVIFTGTIDGTILTLNAAWAEITGWPTEEWIGRNLLDAIVDEDRERAVQAHRTMLETRRRTSYQVWVYGRTSRALLEITSFTRIVDGLVDGVYGFARDITEHHMAEEERQRLTRNLQLLLESTVEGIFTVNVDGRCTMLNRAGAAILGRSAAELSGQPMQPLLRFVDTDVHATPILDVLRDGGARMVPNGAITRADGVVVPIEYSVAAILDAGRPAGAVVSFTDISARRRLEAQLEQANRLSSLGRLAATVAHEFNNVLMGISPFVELLRRNHDRKRVTSALDHISRSVVRGKRITEDILRFTQPAEPVRTTIEVEPWLRSVAVEARSLLPERFLVEVQGESDLRLEADPTQIHQILINLILNARDAMPEGGRIVVNVRREPPSATFAFGVVERPEQFAHFTVCDEGCGMSPEVLHRIFEPLYTTKKSGTGLGLAVTHQVVRRHDGYIFAESTVGKGATFHIFLPLAANDTIPATDQAAKASSSPRARELLLVEDDKGVAAGLVAVLELEGFHVELAETGAEALKLLEFKRPDAVLLDVGLPDGDGTSVYASIAAMHPTLPVIFSTGHADRTELQLLLSLPNISYLLKPYEIETLLEILEKVIN